MKELFGGIVGASAGTAMPTISHQSIEDSRSEFFTDRSGNLWSLRWTGWKPIPDRSSLTGQWLAYPITLQDRRSDEFRPLVYAASGGITDIFRSGDSFDMTQEGGDIHEGTLERDRSAAADATKTRLVQYIESNIAPIDWRQAFKVKTLVRPAGMDPLTWVATTDDIRLSLGGIETERVFPIHWLARYRHAHTDYWGELKRNASL